MQPRNQMAAVFSRMRSSRAMRGRSLTVPQVEAFAFHVRLSVPFFYEAVDGRTA
jgi:hypothetical protein